jgi:release factor H-coupled RctB family protein
MIAPLAADVFVCKPHSFHSDIMGNSPAVEGLAPVHLFASAGSWVEGKALQQLEQVAAMPGIRAVAGMPDLHPGKYGPVGCGILADCLYPQFVGSDIGCGMGLFRLDIPVRKLRLDRLAERLTGLDAPWDGDIDAALGEAGLAATGFDSALGSIGGGNHFCEFQVIEDIVEPEIAASAGLDAASVHLLVHSGSRGLGFSILERHLASGAAALDIDSDAGRLYRRDHDIALHWAALNRGIIALRAAEAARADARVIADLSHNFVELLSQQDALQDAAPLALHRKGAAPSDRGLVPVPGSRGTLSYLVEPLAAGRAETLASLAHGAGRKYDRASTHGRVSSKKSDLARLARNPFGGLVVCEDRDLLVEESPDAYKSIERVIADLEGFGLARVVTTFRPLVTFKTAHSKSARSEERRRARAVREDRR